ncbi:MAG: deaminase, partial [Oscillospiraceae bacterium]|nr:deaminase [Oscillospiraceae bacterium]
LDTKYLYVVHAERNAILNFRGHRKDFEGAKLYVDLFPCNECAKEIIQCGIREVVYLSDKYADLDEFKASKTLLDECGVAYRKLEGKLQKTITLNME